ncbi:MAG: hypothetical protein CME59_20495 [Halioglobus sp.]|nr:hypothetical protein [Halioglobus sp.]
MSFSIPAPTRLRMAFALAALLVASQTWASGAIGDHVNAMADHIEQYSGEVAWLIGKVDSMVDTYAKDGAEAAAPAALVDYWEAVDFHSAIETHYIPLYASIWQGLFGVRTAIEQGVPVAQVREEQARLERVLWQSLGAVKMAAQYQARGLLPRVETTSADTPRESVDVIKQRLDRVLAKYAEQLPKEAIGIVQETYLNLFEGIEGALIEQDAELVEELELDFNVTLPTAIQDGKPVNDVRAVIQAMQDKLDTCKALLTAAEQSRGKVF